MESYKLDKKYGSLEQHLRSGNVWLTEFEKGINKTWEPEHWGGDGFTSFADALEFRKSSVNGVLVIAFA